MSTIKGKFDAARDFFTRDEWDDVTVVDEQLTMAELVRQHPAAARAILAVDMEAGE